MSSPGTNTSATGGPMLPNPAPAPVPLEGTALLDLIQETLVALSGIATALVRPRFQAEPPDIPQSGTAWMSFGITARPADVFPVIQHDGAGAAGEGQDLYQRQEELVVLVSFYDTGSTGQAFAIGAQVRDGLSIPQNMEALNAKKIYLGWTGDLVPLPSLLKQQWLYRVDLEIHFRRQVDRTYRTLNIETAEVDLKSNGSGDYLIEDTINVSE